MRSPWGSFAVLVLGVTAAGRAQAPTRHLLPERGVVLRSGSFEHGRVQSCEINVPNTTENWTPTSDQIHELDSVLGQVLADSLLSVGKPLPKDTSLLRGAIVISVPGYYRQYVGVSAKEHPLIFINGFHESYFDQVRLTDSLDRAFGRHPRHFDWRVTAVQVCDGGVIFFAATYDPATKTIVQFAFNGPG